MSLAEVLTSPNEGDPSVIGVVGAQWGDEGKGKIVDELAQNSQVVVKPHGGDNAGHTVVNEKGKFALHLIPAGIFNPKTVNIVGSGVAFNPARCLEEMTDLHNQNVSTGNLWISEKAPIVLQLHLVLDQAQEENRGKNAIGTTKRGIGPLYMDRAERVALPARFLQDKDNFMKALKPLLEHKIKSIQALRLPSLDYLKSLNPKQDIERICELLEGLTSIPDTFRLDYYEPLTDEWSNAFDGMIVDTDEILQGHLRKGSAILLEGAHGVLLDNIHGTYNKVTSSNTIAAGLLVGAGLPPMSMTAVIGVYKAYQTRVGAGQ